jgi:glycosyltransferase involved in cell wall biosynthesis
MTRFNAANSDQKSPAPPDALLVTDRAFIRAYDGSTAIYAAWFAALKRLGYRVTVVSFNQAQARWTEADVAQLATEADDVLILDAFHSTAAATLNKAERLAWRLVAGKRYPHCLSGRQHQASNAERLSCFLAGRQFSVLVVNKTSSLRLVGRIFDRMTARKLIDVHDNMPRRAQLTRLAALRLIPSHPSLARMFRLDEVGDILGWAGESRLMHEEIRKLQGFDGVLFPAAEEARMFVSAGLEASRVRVVPWPLLATQRMLSRTDEFHIGFFGTDGFFNFEAVQFLAREVLPHLRRMHPQLHVLIAGAISRSAQLVLNQDGVEFVPWVERPADFYRRVQVVLVPMLSGTGVSVKMIEAAFYGSAIVATPVGLRGLALRHEREVLIAEGGEEFANGVSRLLGDSELRASLGANAAAAAAANHSLEAFSRAIGTLLPTTPAAATAD